MRQTYYGTAAAWVAISLATARASTPVAHWACETIRNNTIREPVGIIHGKPVFTPGVEGKSLRFDGHEDYVSTPDTPELSFTDATFSISVWVNLYALDRGQQMIVAKNVYAANQREWSLMADRDNRFRFYLRHDGWQTVAAASVPTPGQWSHVAVTVDAGYGRLYVNGELEGEGRLGSSVPDTPAPITIGGVNNGGRLMQMLKGAVDEIRLYDETLDTKEIRAMADRQTVPHDIPTPSVPVRLWAGGELPKAAAVPLAEGVRVHTIKKAGEGIWMKGVHVTWHKGMLYAQFGYNERLKEQGENSPGEQALFCTSRDGGKTWSEAALIAAGKGEVGISHGVFLSHAGRLWSFNGAFYGKIGKVHTRMFVLDEERGRWEAKGVAVENGFWPLQEPLRMADGNWIMSGLRVGGHHPAAVAISHGDDLTTWDLVVIGEAPGTMWGESSVLLAGNRVTNIARYGARPFALVAESEDYGRTWTPSRLSNLPMATSRPFTGKLSTGQYYLVCSTTVDGGTGRWPLTIAVTAPGERVFRHVFSLNNAKGRFMYPGAVEHAGVLYVGYTNGYTPELAIVPVASLAVPASD